MLDMVLMHISMVDGKWMLVYKRIIEMKNLMTIEEKGKMISRICIKLKFMASAEKKPFDYGDTFLSLCFKPDVEIKNIARLCQI
jgi:hypothetical protein